VYIQIAASRVGDMQRVFALNVLREEVNQPTPGRLSRPLRIGVADWISLLQPRERLPAMSAIPS